MVSSTTFSNNASPHCCEAHINLPFPASLIFIQLIRNVADLSEEEEEVPFVSCSFFAEDDGDDGGVALLPELEEKESFASKSAYSEDRTSQ